MLELTREEVTVAEREKRVQSVSISSLYRLLPAKRQLRQPFTRLKCAE